MVVMTDNQLIAYIVRFVLGVCVCVCAWLVVSLEGT